MYSPEWDVVYRCPDTGAMLSITVQAKDIEQAKRRLKALQSAAIVTGDKLVSITYVP